MMLDYLTYAAIALLIIISSPSHSHPAGIRRGVIFTLGRFTAVKGPGLIILIPVVAAAREGRLSG